MNRKKIVRVFLITINIIALIFTAITVIGAENNGTFGLQIVSDYTTNAILNYLFLALVSYLVMMVSMLFMGIWIIGPIIGYKIFKKTDSVVSNKIDDSGDSIYNRDLPDYNAAVAGYIIDYTTDAKQDYVALFVSLIERGYIKRDFEGNKIGDDVTEINGKGLTTTELFVLNTYTKFKRLTINDFFTFKQAIMKEVIEKGFIKDNSANYEFLRKYAEKLSKENKDPQVVLIAFGYIAVIIGMILFTIIPFPLNILAIIIGIAIIRRKFSLKKYTDIGKKEKEKMGKLRLFMISETDLKNKDINDKNFLKFIPYAIAFDVNEKYEEKFTNILNNLE